VAFWEALGLGFGPTLSSFSAKNSFKFHKWEFIWSPRNPKVDEPILAGIRN
jgi:hypothetical protein